LADLSADKQVRINLPHRPILRCLSHQEGFERSAEKKAETIPFIYTYGGICGA
jgi:hypothetical protein